MKILLFVVFLTQACFAQDPYQDYLQLIQKYPKGLGKIGCAATGEIEIIQDPVKMRVIEKNTGRKVGIVAQDQYWIWINDPVKFSTGKEGVYGRILWSRVLEGPGGIAVMCRLPDGKIALNRNYRHATRSWEYELPRGGMEPNESVESAARREVKEETGMVLGQLVPLGDMAIDTGLTNTVAPILFANVIKQENPTPEESEAIAGIESFSLQELKEGYKQGYLIYSHDGKNEKIPLRDPFLTFALFQAEIRGLLR